MKFVGIKFGAKFPLNMADLATLFWHCDFNEYIFRICRCWSIIVVNFIHFHWFDDLISIFESWPKVSPRNGKFYNVLSIDFRVPSWLHQSTHVEELLGRISFISDFWLIFNRISNNWRKPPLGVAEKRQRWTDSLAIFFPIYTCLCVTAFDSTFRWFVAEFSKSADAQTAAPWTALCRGFCNFSTLFVRCVHSGRLRNKKHFRHLANVRNPEWKTHAASAVCNCKRIKLCWVRTLRVKLAINRSPSTCALLSRKRNTAKNTINFHAQLSATSQHNASHKSLEFAFIQFHSLRPM